MINTFINFLGKFLIVIFNSSLMNRLMVLTISRDFGHRLLDESAMLLRKLSFSKDSSSQLGQDIWVLSKLKWKRNGYFVEVGASDPIILSNSYMLEKGFGWTGALIEPNPVLASKIRLLRSSPVLEAIIDVKSGYDDLIVATENEFSSTAKQLKHSKHHLFRASGRSVKIQTLTLTQALTELNVPADFDYLSVDIEGGELSALLSLDFTKFKPKVLSIEHNFREDRNRIEEYLKSLGYIHDKTCSRYEWDDYYFLDGLE